MSMSAEYQRRHRAVIRAWGKADDHYCVDCGYIAGDWSQTHDSDPDRIDSYSPRCRSCHLIYDKPLRPIPSAKGIKWSDESRRKMSEIAKNRSSRPRNSKGQYV